MVKKIVCGLLATSTLLLAGDIGAKVTKEKVPSICCVVPCTPPLVCNIK
jgi:hypothetical protein